MGSRALTTQVSITSDLQPLKWSRQAQESEKRVVLTIKIEVARVCPPF